MKPETQRDPGRASRPAFLAELFESLTDRTRRLWGRSGAESPAVEAPDLSELGEALLSRRGEASGVAIAREMLAAFDRADPGQVGRDAALGRVQRRRRERRADLAEAQLQQEV